MRGTIPMDDGFDVTKLLNDLPQEDKITPEDLALSKLGASPEWKIISDYLDQRIDVYRKGLFGEDLAKVDTTIIGQRFLAAQSVIHEFEALQAEINGVTQSVKDATAQRSK